jgi:hypothetical protein
VKFFSDRLGINCTGDEPRDERTDEPIDAGEETKEQVRRKEYVDDDARGKYSILGDFLVATKRYPRGLPVNVIETEMFFLDEFMQKKYPGNRTRQKDLLVRSLKTFPDTYEKILAPFNLWEPYKHLLFRLSLDEIGSRYNVVSLTDETGCLLLTDAARKRGVALRCEYE